MGKKQNRKNILDLHGVKHEDAERLVENFVLLNEPPLTIITGKSDVMGHIVINKLSKLGNGWERNVGEVKVLK
tara:strand:+ start:332 stop:550 length:219 start_codon:yes stop_codon:yes gene_type:complete